MLCGSLLATTSADGTCKIWSTVDFTIRNTLKKTPDKWVWDCAFSCDSQYIFTGKCRIQLVLRFHYVTTPSHTNGDHRDVCGEHMVV